MNLHSGNIKRGLFHLQYNSGSSEVLKNSKKKQSITLYVFLTHLLFSLIKIRRFPNKLVRKFLTYYVGILQDTTNLIYNKL